MRPSLFPCSASPSLSISIVLLLFLLIISACSQLSAATEPLATGEILVTLAPATPEDDAGLRPLPTTSPVTSTPTPPPTTTPTPLPTRTATTAPTSTASPTPSPSPTPTPTLRQLTHGGCCVQPFFSPDSQYVLFVDKPASDAPAGIYGVALADPQAQPILVNETIGFRSPDRTTVATIEGDIVRFVDETNGQSWTVDTGGNWPRYSPDGSQILWTASDREGPYDRRESDIWLASLEGGNPRLLVSTIGGGFAGWLPDSQHILLLDRENPDEEERTLKLYNLADDQTTNLVQEKRLRGLEISPGGSWIAYFVSFAEEPDKNGLWVIGSNGLTHQKVNVPGFGAYRWRDDNTLLYIPMRNSSTESMQLWHVDLASNQSAPLTDPAVLSFSISNGDWEVSPDGRHLVFVNSVDQNIWLITLP